MLCLECKQPIDLKNETFNEECFHCPFYFYLRQALSIAVFSSCKVDEYEDFYFKNLHQRIYNRYIMNEEQVEPIDGAEQMIIYLREQMKTLIKDYCKEDLLFMMLGLRELATWKILDTENTWASVQVRNVSHVMTNFLDTLKEEEFGDVMIQDETDFISLFIFAEEIEKISSNILNCLSFNLSPSLSQMIKERQESEELSKYFSYFEVDELQKPEEISFTEESVNKFLANRGITIPQIKDRIGTETARLFGFSFEDLSNFRKTVVHIAKAQGQVFEIFPLAEDTFMEVVFVFKEQLKEWEGKLENILKYLTYKPIPKNKRNPKTLYDPHLDYKFIFEYENMIAIGIMDSANSITMFENIASSDHFIEEVFGSRATKIFQKAQSDIAYLMGMKIAVQFAVKEGFYVPMQEKGVPNVNIKTVKGNGIKMRIFNCNNQDLGDFDAVVIDLKNKKILIFEIKYFKPSMNFRELYLKDKKIMDDIPKIIARHEWMYEHRREVVRAWGLEAGEYSVETLLMTGRPNFYGKEVEKMDERVRYVTFDEVLRNLV